MREIGHFIGGKQVAGTSGRTSNVYNPATGEVQATVALASVEELRAAVENAKAAQPKWAATNPQRRARVFFKFVELLNKHMDELAEILSKEHGKTIEDAKGDVIRGLEVCEFVCGIPISPRASSPRAPGRRSTCIRSASRSASAPALRLSISRA